jgi:hypothetical protein
MADESDDDKVDSDLSICKIIDMDGFIKFLKDKSFEQFTHKIKKYIGKEIKVNLKSIKQDDLMPTAVIMLEVNKFFWNGLEVDGNEVGNKNDVFIMKYHIEDTVKTLSNEIIYKFLAKLVDAGTLEMCWDTDFNQFIWRNKIMATADKAKPKRKYTKKKKED